MKTRFAKQDKVEGSAEEKKNAEIRFAEINAGVSDPSDPPKYSYNLHTAGYQHCTVQVGKLHFTVVQFA